LERFGLVGRFAVGLLGAINIPYYEEMAKAFIRGNTVAAE